MDTLTEPLRQELRSLEAQGADLDAKVSKLQVELHAVKDKAEKVKAVLEAYGVRDNVEPDTVGATEPRRELFGTHSRTPRQSKTAALRAEITRILLERGSEHRQKLLDRLMEKGLMGREKVPLASLAAYLSENRELFESDGRGNFSIRKPSSPPSNGAADSGAHQ